MEIIDGQVQYYNGEFQRYSWYRDSYEVDPFKDAIGKIITNIEVEDNRLKIRFEDGTGVALHDDGQSCCEYRYMTCDDYLSFAVGATLLGGQTKDAPSIHDGYDCHDVQFLEIITNRGSIVVHSHNEHNGYYGGFSITAYSL